MVNLANKAHLDRLYFFAGIIGSLVTIYGLLHYPFQLYYVIGSFFLLTTAVHFKLTYFIALEMILLGGHGTILLRIGPVLQVALPVLLCLQLLAYYLLSGQLRNLFLLIGIFGIALLSVGFAYSNQWIFFFGGISIAVYAFYLAYQGQRIALLWAILNTFFALFAIINLFA